MTDAHWWLEANSRYLSAALAWLRLLLEHRAREAAESEQSAQVPAKDSKNGCERGYVSERAAEQELERIESEMSSAPSLNLLSERLGLSKFERNILLLCAASEFDPSVGELFARASGDNACAYATFSLALSIFEEPAWDALSPHRPLRYWRLIEINQPGSQSLTTSPLRADERIVNYIKGLNYLDDRLTSYLAPVDLPLGGEELPESQREMVGRITAYWRQPRATASMPFIRLLGIDGASKLIVAAHAGAAVGRRLYRLPIDALPQQSGDLELLLRLWQRESALLPVALYVDAQEAETSGSGGAATLLRRFLSRSDGILIVAVRESWASMAQESWTVDVAKPTTEEQRQEWAKLVEDDIDAPALLAGQFNLNLSDIRQIAVSATSEKTGDEMSMSDRVWDACRTRVRPLLDSLAHRLELKATWEDIVLPDQELVLLQQIAGQVKHRTKVYADWGFVRKMNRGLGITALFAGESGTGKTLAAEVLANELRLNLYRIDLSAVVSKYIGETEKNLRRVFDAAEDGGAILFFDEADALFGKRSEVKDSHDRYANIEVNYLLQRMEAYRGLAILATNMRSALDTAFTRRLRFIVTFPFPSTGDRARMWQRAFPTQTPVDDLDYARLARVNLTGGSIHNAAINAAFLAAETDRPVNMGAVLKAIRNELVKMDRPINEADFHWHEPTGVVA
jgi:DNA polymerase III delta prime subunit